MRSEFELDLEEKEMIERMAKYEAAAAGKRLELDAVIRHMIEEARSE